MNNSENLPTDNNNKSIVKGKTMYNWETHDNQDKVIVDSINAIERRREHMTDEQLRKAYAELQTGLGPDIYSQLCDRKASDNFQGCLYYGSPHHLQLYIICGTVKCCCHNSIHVIIFVLTKTSAEYNFSFSVSKLLILCI